MRSRLEFLPSFENLQAKLIRETTGRPIGHRDGRASANLLNTGKSAIFQLIKHHSDLSSFHNMALEVHLSWVVNCSQKHWHFDGFAQHHSSNMDSTAASAARFVVGLKLQVIFHPQRLCIKMPRRSTMLKRWARKHLHCLMKASVKHCASWSISSTKTVLQRYQCKGIEHSCSWSFSHTWLKQETSLIAKHIYLSGL